MDMDRDASGPLGPGNVAPAGANNHELCFARFYMGTNDELYKKNHPGRIRLIEPRARGKDKAKDRCLYLS
jgi:hypothetical protein